MKNMRLLRQNAKKSQQEIANYLGCDRSTYTKYETGSSEPPFEVIRRLAEFYNESVDFIMSDVSTAPSAGRGVRIPVLGNVAAGIPIDAIEDILDYEEIDQALASTGEFFGLKIKGHSMEPRICDGDVVIIRKQEDVETGELAVVLINGDSATVKKIKKGSSGIGLIPLNPSYEPTYYTSEEIESLPVSIIGKVVELRGKF